MTSPLGVPHAGPDPHIRAAFYLSPTLDAWWRWADDGRTLAWADGRTIAFLPEVEAVLGRLAPGGLPPFGAVALLLAACRDGWADSPGRSTVAGYARALGGVETTTGGGGGLPAAAALPFVKLRRELYARHAKDADRLLAGLDAVAALPADLRGPGDARLVLAETVFEGLTSRGTPADAALVVRALADGVRAETLRPQLTAEEPLTQFVRHVDGLAAGLARVEADALRRRARTGLDEPVRPPEDDLSPPDKVRRLLAELRADPDLAGIARLAADLMAAVAVPRSLRSREELAMGGVSDLTNRGPLDRLVVSELAHDDLTLAVRVAVNEALYLRRESPPREPPHARAILIDAGVRTWGLPRAFLAAVALALAATNDQAAGLKVFRAAGGGRVVPVDLTTRAGLEAHMAALETEAHPGAALEAFLVAAAEASGSPADAGSATDAFVLTQADAAADPDFLAAARASGAPLLYVAAVDRDGSFRLSARTRAGERPVREARLSLDALTDPPKRPRPKTPLVDPTPSRSDLPAIFSAEPFPLLLHHKADPKATVASSHGLVTVTGDGRVLLWKAPDPPRQWGSGTPYGGRQLHGLVPPGPVIARGTSCDGEVAHFAVARRHDRFPHVVTAALKTGTCVVARLDREVTGRVTAFFVGQNLCVLAEDRVEVFHAGGSRVSHRGGVDLPAGLRHARGRFFRGAKGWWMLTISTAVRFEAAPVPPQAVAAFDVAGVDGVGYVLDTGEVYGHGLKYVPYLRVPRGFTVLGVSETGRRITVLSGTRQHVWDLAGHAAAAGSTPITPGSAEEELLAPAIYASTRAPFAPRSKFDGIGRTLDGLLALVRRSALVPAAAGPMGRATGTPLVLRTVSRNELRPDPGAKPFVNVIRGGPARVHLRVASWADGSRAWLDPRGLLHLRSSNPAVPELSMTLHEGAAAAWTSEGKVCGPPFNVGSAEQTDPTYFIDVMRRFAGYLR